ncbi:serine/threonine-protein kinase [Candidatus Magnetobacterium casense]|uniref:Protein kinase n=1 Tax=Candidatus Magnetobacterium casense TaxID=1455061 RepID=A0ABS6RZ87_9BACT|nr:serine/threonine-protein kinase [Candidatus Magnetobacterium casensis]MBV6341665.1 protein kinase [Candidatus Magnetobacterium casensis]
MLNVAYENRGIMGTKHIFRIGKYDLKEEIGRGGMGIVYRGVDPYINREVAIKVANAENMHDSENANRYRRMFFNEARCAGILDHPNIVHVYDAGIEIKHCYLVMEFVRGAKSLKDYCKPDKLLPREKVIEIIFKCCKALDYAHNLGIIHRDIKPGNIMMTEDLDVKIGDFSIAQLNKTDVTQVGGLMGSPQYMSPEQIKEEELTNQTDLYSLGVVMYELLTGMPPMKADNLSSLILKIINDDPLPMHVYKPDMPEVLEMIVKKAINKNPQQRYPRGIDFAADLVGAMKSLKHADRVIKEQVRHEMLRKLEFFNGFFNSELSEVMRASSWVEHPANDPIITEGDIDDSFFIIVSGQVQVKKGDRPLVILKAGDCFGEMGFITKAKRSASIISATDVTLLKISGTMIDRTSPQCQIRFNKMFLKTLITRLSRTSDDLSKMQKETPLTTSP